MPRVPSPRRRALAGLLAGVLAAGPVLAQTAPPAPATPAAPPPAWAQGRTDAQAASTLAPIAPRLTATPVERIPLDRIRVPEGFRVELWASGLPGGRMMTRGDDGTVYVGTRTIGRVYAVADRNGERTVRVFAQRLDQPNGVAFRDGSLYVVALHRVLRYDRVSGTAETPVPTDLTAAFALPTEAHHGWKFAAFAPDGRLHLNVGAPCNVCTVDEDRHALIVGFNPDGTGREVVARGIRNSVGFDWQPGSGTLWATNNGRDWVGEDSPPDTLHRLDRVGEHHGFPFCAAGWQDPGHAARACSEFPAAAAPLGPHAAALGMRFYDGAMFPAAYRGRAFIARHGSWNREAKLGYDVVTARVGPDGAVTIEPFLTGLLDPGANAHHGRPTDVLVQPDGSLLVSDEENGAIYRVVHGR